MSNIQSRRINHPFLIGLFVIIGTLLMLAVIFWLGASQFLKEQTFYATYFEGSVEGLEKGSAVKYRGMPCGSVTDINVAPDGRAIEVIMRIDPTININDSLRAKSELAGIAGGKFIQLYYPIDAKIAKMYPKINFETPYPVIKSAPSGFEEIEIAMREVMQKFTLFPLSSISDKAIHFLDASGRFFNNPDFYTTLEELDEASQRLNNILGQADTSRVFGNLALSTDRLLITSSELMKFTANLNRQFEQMNLTDNVKSAFGKYDTTMYNMNRVVVNVGYRMESLIFSLNETLEQIRSTNKQLRKSLRAISDNPSQVFFSEPPPPDE